MRVIAAGSINGVDASRRFLPSRSREAGASLRVSFNIPHNAPVIGFVGRISRDKGVEDLGAAWSAVHELCPGAHLLVVGDTEQHDPVSDAVQSMLRGDAHVHFTGHLTDPAAAYAAMDVLAVPSHREGFGLSALEAGAMEVPVVASRVTGLVDAVVDGTTGTLVPIGDPDTLARALLDYLGDQSLRREHGRAGRLRACSTFSPIVIWREVLAVYLEQSRSRRHTVSSSWVA